jgi:aspartate racemase
MQKLGVVGGMGAETSCKFCLALNTRARSALDRQPDISMDILPLSKKAQDRIIKGWRCKEHFRLMKRSILSLQDGGCDFIVIPCNTVHIFLNELRRISKVPILSIMEEVAGFCSDKGFTNVGVVGSSMTVKSGLHEKELSSRGVDVVLPDRVDQDSLDELILSLLEGSIGASHRKRFARVLEHLVSGGAEAIVLACTDFGGLVSEKDVDVPLVDTLDVLEDATFDKIIKGAKR